MDFDKIARDLFLADDRTPDQIREAVLGHQQRIDMARKAGRLIETAEDASKRRQGTRDRSCLPGYADTAEGRRAGDVTCQSFSRDYV